MTSAKALALAAVVAAAQAASSDRSYLQLHYFATDNWADPTTCTEPNWKLTLQSRISSCANSTSSACTPPWEYRINLEKPNMRVDSTCSADSAELTLPISKQNVAIVKFYGESPICEPKMWESVYAIKANSGECMKNFLNDSVATGTRNGYVKIVCSSQSSLPSRISFFADNACTKRIPSEVASGPGYINLDDKCFRGTNYIRAFCQSSEKANELSDGEKFSEDCAKNPKQEKCVTEFGDRLKSGAFGLFESPIIANFALALLVVIGYMIIQ